LACSNASKKSKIKQKSAASRAAQLAPQQGPTHLNHGTRNPKTAAVPIIVLAQNGRMSARVPYSA
jgi:hypothetical protein